MITKETLEMARWRRDNLKEIRKRRQDKTKLARKALIRLAYT